MGRSTEHHALGEAEAQIAQAEALFEQEIMERQHQTDFDIANVRREATLQEEEAYMEIAAAQADVETQLAQAAKRESDRVAQARTSRGGSGSTTPGC